MWKFVHVNIDFSHQYWHAVQLTVAPTLACTLYEGNTYIGMQSEWLWHSPWHVSRLTAAFTPGNPAAAICQNTTSTSLTAVSHAGGEGGGPSLSQSQKGPVGGVAHRPKHRGTRAGAEGTKADKEPRLTLNSFYLSAQKGPSTSKFTGCSQNFFWHVPLRTKINLPSFVFIIFFLYPPLQ